MHSPLLPGRTTDRTCLYEYTRSSDGAGDGAGAVVTANYKNACLSLYTDDDEVLVDQKTPYFTISKPQVPGNFLEPGLVDLHQITSAHNIGTSGILADDSWEWDETDMTISESEEAQQNTDPSLDLPARKNPNSTHVYQVYNIHDVELYKQPLFPQANLENRTGKLKLLTKSLSKDSSFSSVESLPDILGGIVKQKQEKWNRKENGIERGISVSSRRSESESGIDVGDTETASSETQDFECDVDDGKLTERCKLERNDKLKEEMASFSSDFERLGEVLEKKSYKRRPRKCAGEAVEILINGRGILTPADSDSDLEFESTKPLQEFNTEQKSGSEKNRFSPVLSHGSSLESLLAMGVELFPMQRSASLDNANRENEEIIEKNDLNLDKLAGNSSEELSRRTLDLLKRLENIQSPLGGKMTRSVSDMALITMSPSSRIPASPSLGGKISPLSGISFHLSPPSLIREGSTATSLSSVEDLSQTSDENKFLDPANAANANFCCRKRRNRLDEVDAASLSMVVNVSSACTDDEDDNSDLLSSSTLTEEELGVRDEMDERFSATSSANEEEFDSPFGMDYMQKELQNWIRTPFSKSEIGLKDELQCGSNLHRNENTEKAFLNPSKFIGNRRNVSAEEENRRNATRSYISRFVDDVENGNVEQSCLKSKDADDELLREEASVFTKKSEALRDPYVYANSEEIAQDMSDFFSQSENGKQDASKYLVGQLKGELPCHNLSTPTENSTSHDALRKTSTRKAITIQEKFKFMSLVTEQAKREVRDRDSHNKRRHGAHCCSHHPGSFYCDEPRPEEENVHSFVMEIMDMTNARRNSNETERREETASIRDKVLEHAHRPVQLRKGDFYSYLSLSSHDSDCGEVLQLLEDKSNSPTPEQLHKPTAAAAGETTPPEQTVVHPLSPDIRDEETLFPACTEEVYLGPPLCYSLSAPKRHKQDRELRTDPGNVRGPSPSYYSVLERETEPHSTGDHSALLSPGVRCLLSLLVCVARCA
ncbi:hypothetical protein WMY93_033886 [Mugilogobius chulae]|uniref:Uncharacterized protein n=1 Tax=Mugilogobius chulae TaxID=88201 RepID=A0AAW0MS71_9GOBI